MKMVWHLIQIGTFILMVLLHIVLKGVGSLGILMVMVLLIVQDLMSL